MKHFLLIRHAKSSWKFPELSDKERPLNSRGKRDAPFMASYIKAKGFAADYIVSSPANRALTTAKFFHSAFELEENRLVIETDLYFGSDSDWLDLIHDLDEKIKSPAFFSHNPTITYFANSFMKDDFLDNVPTCGIIQLASTAEKWSEVEPGNTDVVAYYFPKLVKDED